MQVVRAEVDFVSLNKWQLCATGSDFIRQPPPLPSANVWHNAVPSVGNVATATVNCTQRWQRQEESCAIAKISRDVPTKVNINRQPHLHLRSR